MSLSFVSSAVQIGTSDGGFEETPIENKETEAVNRRNAHKPLFEQLRSNQEEDQEKKDEMQRQIMRSTCALNDEDVAHLDSLERQRSDRERKIQERTQNELNNFRAAKALRRQAALAGHHADEDSEIANAVDLSAAASSRSGIGVQKPGEKKQETTAATNSLPVIKVKKRKHRKLPIEMASKNENSKKSRALDEKGHLQSELKDKRRMTSFSNETESAFGKGKDLSSDSAEKSKGDSGLGGLLSGYGSSSDED